MFNAKRLFLNRMSMELPSSMSTLSNCTLLIQGYRCVVIIVVIVVVVKLAIIIAGRVPAIVVIAPVSPWIDASNHVIVVVYMVVWAGRCS
jgi:hypothetical protein